MKKYAVLGSICLLFVGLSGCGASGADGLMQEMIGEMNDLAAAAESNAPDSKIKEIQDKMTETGKKLDALKLTDDEKKKLTEKYQEPMQKAADRMLKAMMAKGMKDMGGALPGMPTMPGGK